MVGVTYRREMNHNYMIIVSPEGVTGGYECRMLADNCIEGLLKFRILHQEERKDFYYEITSKQPLKRLFEQRTITGDEIRCLLLSMAATLNKVEEYLLREEQILLDPEYIYVEPDQFSVYLCMVPGHTCNFPEAFTGLLQYLLEKVDHQDKDGVVLAYHLYHESLKENYGMADLLRYLTKEDGPIFERKKTAEENPDRDSRTERPHGEEEEETFRGEYDTEYGAEYTAEQLESSEKQKQKQKQKQTNRYSVLAACFIKNLVLLAGGLAALWFLAGKEAAGRYGPIMGIVLLGSFFFKCILLKFPSSKNIDQHKQKKPDSRTERNVKRYKDIEKNHEEAGPESWRIRFDDTGREGQNVFRAGAKGSEAETEAGTEEETESETEASEAVGTALLADFSAQTDSALLESLSRDRETIKISYVPFLIGKHADMTDYCLKQPTVSRLHLRIDKKEGVYIATDLNSTNGTTVEGYHLQANETVSIKNGDVIYLADVGFRFIERD